MSTINSKNVQVGTSNVAAENFTLYQPSTPDGTVRLGVGNSGATTADVVTVNSAGVTVTGTLTATTLSGSLGAATATSLTVNGNNISAVNSLGFRNRIINGDMRIDQRNAGASVTVNSGTNTFGVDRWKGQASGGGVYTQQRSTTAPAGFTNSVLLTVTTADSSIASTDYYIWGQAVEGFNAADFGWGTANAQTVTLSFWVRSSVTGTYALFVGNNGDTRSLVATYTISAANTWEQKTVTIAGDTSGTWATDNSIGIGLWFTLGAGSSFNATANVWNASLEMNTSGATNIIATSGATFYITGVQLEAGTVASPFERRDYGRELAMCQRYAAAINGSNGMGGAGGTTSFQQRFVLPSVMRASPTLSTIVAGSANYTDDYFADVTTASATFGLTQANTFFLRAEVQGFSGLTSGRFYAGRGNGTAVILASAEL